MTCATHHPKIQAWVERGSARLTPDGIVIGVGCYGSGYPAGRYLLRCSSPHSMYEAWRMIAGTEGPYCGRKVWLDLAAGERIAFCSCGAEAKPSGRLEVPYRYKPEGTRKHSCAADCQTSESRICRCSCGGKRHGELLRDGFGGGA